MTPRFVIAGPRDHARAVARSARYSEFYDYEDDPQMWVYDPLLGGWFSKAIKSVFKSAGKVAKAAAPIALSFIPGAGPVLASGYEAYQAQRDYKKQQKQHALAQAAAQAAGMPYVAPPPVPPGMAPYQWGTGATPGFVPQPVAGPMGAGAPTEFQLPQVQGPTRTEYRAAMVRQRAQAARAPQRAGAAPGGPGGAPGASWLLPAAVVGGLLLMSRRR